MIHSRRGESVINFIFKSTLLFVLLLQFIDIAQAFQGIPGLYCGLENCYEVLGASRESSRDEIIKLYRGLARKWHPDRFHGKEEKATATEKFRQIATAYEVLKEDESKKDYNDMLDDPEQYYRHYYRYYRRVYGAKVDARWVILGFICITSICHYFVMHSRYNEAIDYFAQDRKYRYKAQEMAKQRGLLPIAEKKASNRDATTGAKRSRHKTKEEIKEQEEAVLRLIIEENLDIRGGFAKPDVFKIFWLRLPVFLFNYCYWYIRWVYKFDFKSEPYGEDEKIYLISKYLGVSEEQLCINEDIDSLLRQELWIKEKFTAWKKRKDQEAREKLAEKPSYKRYRRYLKKGGPGQITFLDD